MKYGAYSNHDNSSGKKKPLENKGSESSSPVVGGVSDEGCWTRLLVLSTNSNKFITRKATIEILLITGRNRQTNGRLGISTAMQHELNRSKFKALSLSDAPFFATAYSLFDADYRVKKNPF